ncbi:MAG: glutamate formimidoyltransferase [bacterium]|nr:glutamate formimidoyltransferase [bacterium]MBU1916865.1 glutamate formimidoyltransferase [bacterium]
MKKIIECVPNFSEGRDLAVIKQITDQIEAVEGVSLLDVDPGKATNRTVVTLVGSPDAVIEAAVRAIKKASELIDMSKHTGAHPRFGATDVCPLVPVSNVTMEETVAYAHKLAQRIGEELGIGVYCYEHAAQKPERRNLATVRSGEYEGLAKKLTDPNWKPDFGPDTFNPKSGVTAVSARDFLIAYNVNLNTTSTRRANAIAFDVREKGRPKREGNSLTGKIIKDENGNNVMLPGSLKSVKGIGWFIEEFGVAQVSLNLTNISLTPLHVVFDDVCQKAQARGIRATGSEIVGLIPLKSMLDAGRYFLTKQKRSLGVSDKELIKIAVKSMGLDDLYPFKAEEKIIEYVIADKTKSKLIGMTLKDLVEETASESPAPGGGSISAAVGAMGAALATMVANLSSHKPGWDDKWLEFSEWAEKGKAIHDELLRLVDEDTFSFNQIMAAFRLPKSNDEETKARTKAIQEATRYAIEVPFMVMKKAYESLAVIRAMAETGNPNSVSDAGVGALCARTAVMGAFLNVKINSGDLEDKSFVNSVINEGNKIEEDTLKLEKEILTIVNSKI